MRNLTLALATAASIAISAPATAGPTEDFHKLMDDYWAAYLKDNPLTASSVGVKTYDRELAELSLAEFDRQAAEADAFLKRLRAIPSASLNAMDQSNRAVLERTLDDQIRFNRFGQRQLLYSSLGSYHDYMATMGENIPMRDKADYENYLARLTLVPARMKAYSDMSVKAANEGYTQACEWMRKLPEQTLAFVPADPTQSPFYGPFAGSRPPSISAGDWANLQSRAREQIQGPITASYKSFASIAQSQLVPKCRTVDSVASQPGGKDYYAALVRLHTTTDLTPDQIHQIGLQEVARIRAEMEAVAKKAGFASREAMIADMRTNPKWYVTTPEELMEKTAIVTKTIDGKMTGYFSRLPRLPYGIRPMTAATAPTDTTARYQPGSPEGGIAGFYLVNTTKLDQRPLWEIPVLSVHEAVPGHHMQIAIQQELDMPQWRKATTFYTAFVEGWGLYSERLGTDMGLYDTPQKDMGRLSYQMWRATRLVVDTGIHSMGWDKAKAVAFMKDNTALTDANIDAEVNRYISVPGQATAYMIGKRKIEDLRARAEKSLGDKFDIRRFHDAVLGQGAVPLDALERQIDAWIASEKARG
ncbi:DUF885 domain-containing protein [Sphingomonas daechungensis]|uniref:DUF885 domain-containing protein n=2 Tax=Sphingomonas daechungensis TaxID=1176646 RepID=UPI0031F04016